MQSANRDQGQHWQVRRCERFGVCWRAAVITLCVSSPSFAQTGTAPTPADRSTGVIAYEPFELPLGPPRSSDADGGQGWKSPWRFSRTPAAEVVASPGGPTQPASSNRSISIRGTLQRNNPLRRQLPQPLASQQLFVRFDLTYRDPTRTDGSAVDPEFFVLWLDRLDGGDRATHANNVPNIGLHIADRGPKKGRNVFMIRIGSSRTAWSKVELKSDRTYRLVGRLAKSTGGERSEFDRFDLWVDPRFEDLPSPAASLSGAASISRIQWLGFATGLKTEPTDRIEVDNLLLAHDWQTVVTAKATELATVDAPVHMPAGWDQTVDFRSDIYPLLKSRCFDCHAGENPESGYRLDVHRELLGYSSGEVLVEPGRARTSRLIKVLTDPAEENRMPPGGVEPLSPSEIALVASWINQGLPWDDELLPPPRRESDHWAFQPIASPAIPPTSNPAWVRTPVDAFIAQAHQAAGIGPAPPADRRTLVRRVYLDLLGLPPTVNEIEQFLNDDSPQAWERLVERLLASPHYGERWGRYWLDLARWAESQGYQHDFVRPYAWRYRDYVIDSFNKDKPYDRFLKEQLAGDELRPYADENLIATGFLGAARISGNQEDEQIQRNDVLVDIVNATGSVMLGLTLECAQCHNHKFDPLSQRDYYRLQAFFVKGQLGNLSLRGEDIPNPTDLSRWIPKPAYDYYTKEVKSLVRKKMFEPTETPHTWGFLSAATGDPSIQRLPVVNRKPIVWSPESLKHARARLLVRGDVAAPAQQLSPGWPEVLGLTPSQLGDRPRSALADWMADPKNPLVSRVWVNRLWQFHFGRGLVATASDFGVEGAAPTHPELLDWLASSLMENGWSTKHIHRQIVLSSTYRQRRTHHAQHAQIDPDNRLLWTWPRRRLEAEAIRDSVLVVSGELDRSVGGVSVPPEREEQSLRRTIYLFQQRSQMPSVMAMFDAPDGIASCARRSVSTVALQPLFMLNSDFMARRATAMADTVRRQAGRDPDQQIKLAFQRSLGRQPDQRERELARRVIAQQSGVPAAGSASSGQITGLMHLCHALLNLNEFVYVP